MVSPTRTCFACRSRKGACDLLRFTVNKVDNLLVLDGVKKADGRGVYCCKSTECLAGFVNNKKGLKRSLKVKTLDIIGVEELL